MYDGDELIETVMKWNGVVLSGGVHTLSTSCGCLDHWNLQKERRLKKPPWDFIAFEKNSLGILWRLICLKNNNAPPTCETRSVIYQLFDDLIVTNFTWRYMKRKFEKLLSPPCRLIILSMSVVYQLTTQTFMLQTNSGQII